MRFVTYRHQGYVRTGALRGNEVIDLRIAYEQYVMGKDKAPETDLDLIISGDMTQLIAAHEGSLEWLAPAIAEADASAASSLEQVELLAPVPRPGKIIGVGRNYGAHASEGGLEQQEKPRLFFKAPTSVTGPRAAILRPSTVTKLDWEVELGVIVGRRMHCVTEADALDYVLGYTVLNDVSAREFQFDVTPPQTSFAKSMDTFMPMGPVLVTQAELPRTDALELRCWVNGELMQRGNTQDMIYPVAYLLSYISQHLTLEPGDVVATGTPAGVGCFRSPPVYLQPGDIVRMEIAGIGVLENAVDAASDQTLNHEERHG